MSSHDTKKKRKGSIIRTEEDSIKNKNKIICRRNSPFFSHKKFPNKKRNLYIGEEPVEIKKNQLPMDLFRRYLQNILDNAYGFLVEHMWDNCLDVRTNTNKVLAHMFKSILAYNKILTYTKVWLYDSHKHVILGEPMGFYMDDKSCELKILFFMPCIENILNNNSSQPIRFSDDISKDGTFKDSLSIVFEKEISDNSMKYDYGDYDIELQNLLLKLFLIADHAATHFIEEYKTKSTDWVNHHKFGAQFNGEIVTYCSVFDISASVVTNASKPIIISGRYDKEENNSNNNWDFMFNSSNFPGRYYVRPLEQIHDNIGNLLSHEY